MSNDIVPFDFEGSAIRVATFDGEPWWVLGDVCRALKIADAGTSARRLDEDERGVHTMQTPGGPQDVTIINESGLYSLILTSRKAAARRFKKWVTSEVLPSIRRTGAYAAPGRRVTLRDVGGVVKGVTRKQLVEMILPVIAELKTDIMDQWRREFAQISGTDPAIVRNRGYRSMRDLAVSHGCRPGLKGALSFAAMVNGASSMARAWCAIAEARPDAPHYPNGLCTPEWRTEGRSGVWVFHEVGISVWLKEVGIPRFRAHNDAANGQTVLSLVRPIPSNKG